jgi:hypothetical protein
MSLCCTQLKEDRGNGEKEYPQVHSVANEECGVTLVLNPKNGSHSDEDTTGKLDEPSTVPAPAWCCS